MYFFFFTVNLLLINFFFNLYWCIFFFLLSTLLLWHCKFPCHGTNKEFSHLLLQALLTNQWYACMKSLMDTCLLAWNLSSLSRSWVKRFTWARWVRVSRRLVPIPKICRKKKKITNTQYVEYKPTKVQTVWSSWSSIPAGRVARPPEAPAALSSRSQRRGTAWQSDGGIKVWTCSLAWCMTADSSAGQWSHGWTGWAAGCQPDSCSAESKALCENK